MTMTLDRPAELTMRYRRKHPEEHSVMLGRAQLGFPVRLPCEEHLVMLAPPRTGKSALLGKVILRYRGPVLSTTTRADLYKHTYRARLKRGGTVHTFNPQGIGGVPSSFAFDVIGGTPEDRGCLDISTAIRRANAFAYAVSSQGMEDGAFWASKTSRLSEGVLLRRRLRPVAGLQLRASGGCPVGSDRPQRAGRGHPEGRGRRALVRGNSPAARPGAKDR